MQAMGFFLLRDDTDLSNLGSVDKNENKIDSSWQYCCDNKAFR